MRQWLTRYAPDAVIHTLNNGSGLCGVVITNKEYPAMVVTPLLKKITHEFSIKHTQSAINAATANSLRFPELKTYIVEYQNPQEVDKILKIQQELDATKQVLVQTMDSVLERGEKVSELVAKSNDLSASSKMFYTQVGPSGLQSTIYSLLTFPCTGQEAELLLRRHVNILRA